MCVSIILVWFSSYMCVSYLPQYIHSFYMWHIYIHTYMWAYIYYTYMWHKYTKYMWHTYIYIHVLFFGFSPFSLFFTIYSIFYFPKEGWGWCAHVILSILLLYFYSIIPYYIVTIFKFQQEGRVVT